MNHQSLLTARALTFPLDAVDTDVVVVQLKGYRQKDSYFTIAAFETYQEAFEFIDFFPGIPNCKLRIVDCYMNTLLETDRFCAAVKNFGTLKWWLETSQELKDVVTGDKDYISIKKPMWLRRVINKLRSYIK